MKDNQMNEMSAKAIARYEFLKRYVTIKNQEEYTRITANFAHFAKGEYSNIDDAIDAAMLEIENR